MTLVEQGEPEDQCRDCGGDLIVACVTTVGDPHDSWLVYCRDCGLEEAREDLGIAYGY